MCRPVACKTCGKTTWAGCGMHVDQVMRHVPSDQRCPGHPGRSGRSGRSGEPGQPGQGGLLRRLLGRS